MSSLEFVQAELRAREAEFNSPAAHFAREWRASREVDRLEKRLRVARARIRLSVEPATQR
jgi:hypothetical protein